MTQVQDEPLAVIPDRPADAAAGERERLWRDRKLGHEWADWDGRVDAGVAYLDESPRLILFALGILLGLYFWLPAATVAATARYVSRIIDLPLMEQAATAAAAVFTLLPTLLWAALALSALTGLCLVPYTHLRRPLCRITIWLYPIVERIGLTRDRLGASTVALCNALTAARGLRQAGSTILVLAPRCMANFHKKEILEMAAARGLTVHVAPTGRSAREKVIEVRPGAIIAIACQRDLVTGIRDVHRQIPVLSIPLKMPHGPCKDTFIALRDLQAAFDLWGRSPA
ncbi:MAG: hypothetical protein Kow0059_15150 [Candidatus Sumerlaeia bacterium]